MLEVRNITKEFPGVKALSGVNIQFNTGEIHALMGENGAGKSTLMKIMTGIYKPDLGEIYLDGKKVEMKSYRDSINYDISMVHQEIQVIPKATVAENIVLDKISSFAGAVSKIVDNDTEDPDERRKRIEAEENGSALGTVLGLGIGMIANAVNDGQDETLKPEPDYEQQEYKTREEILEEIFGADDYDYNIYDDSEDEDEDEGFSMTL